MQQQKLSDYIVHEYFEIDNHDSFERYWKIVETIAFICIGLFLLAGVLGLLGGKKASVDVPGMPITVSYEKFTRYQGSTTLKIQIEKPLALDALHVTVGKGLFRYANLNGLMPRAATEKLTADGIEYTFQLAPDHLGTVLLNLTPKKAGDDHIDLTIEGHSISLEQFIYP